MLAEREALQPNTEILTWHPADTLPDADQVVLMGWEADGWEAGYWDGEHWRLCYSGAVVTKVTHWADPAGPR